MKTVSPQALQSTSLQPMCPQCRARILYAELNEASAVSTAPLKSGRQLLAISSHSRDLQDRGADKVSHRGLGPDDDLQASRAACDRPGAADAGPDHGLSGRGAGSGDLKGRHICTRLVVWSFSIVTKVCALHRLGSTPGDCGGGPHCHPGFCELACRRMLDDVILVLGAFETLPE